MKKIALTIGIYLIPIFAFAQADTTELPSPVDEPFFFVVGDQGLQFKGYAQVDFYYPFKDSLSPSFIINRARLAAAGFFEEKFRYMLYLRMDEGMVELNEAFIESRHLSFAKLRIGQFKVPFSLSNLRSSSQLDLIGRPIIIDHFSPSYDIGAMIFGDFYRNNFFYALGIFNGNSQNKAENNDDKAIIGRLSYYPLEDVMIGASFARGNHKGSFEDRAITTSDNFGIIKIDTAGIFQLNRYGIDFYIIKKSFSLKAEYLQHSFINNSKFTGGYITFTHMLAGSDKMDGENINKQDSFKPSTGNWGALEFVVQTEIFNATFSGDEIKGYKNTTGLHTGINWYLNEHVKMLVNYQRQWLKNNTLEPNPRGIYNSIMFRAQFQF